MADLYSPKRGFRWSRIRGRGNFKPNLLLGLTIWTCLCTPTTPIRYIKSDLRVEFVWWYAVLAGDFRQAENNESEYTEVENNYLTCILLTLCLQLRNLWEADLILVLLKLESNSSECK